MLPADLSLILHNFFVIIEKGHRKRKPKDGNLTNVTWKWGHLYLAVEKDCRNTWKKRFYIALAQSIFFYTYPIFISSNNKKSKRVSKPLFRIRSDLELFRLVGSGSESKLISPGSDSGSRVRNLAKTIFLQFTQFYVKANKIVPEYHTVDNGLLM